MTINTSFRIQDYKSYGKEGAGFDRILPINLIIGRNNVGKSALLDALDFLCDVGSGSNRPASSSTTITETLEEGELRKIFPSNLSSGNLTGNHWSDNGALLVGSIITWQPSLPENNNKAIFSVKHPDGTPVTGARLDHLRRYMANRAPKINGMIHARLAADRDIAPEQDNGEFSLSSTGSGATRIIHRLLQYAEHDRSLIQTRLLTALNAIFSPDIYFNEITTRFLSSENKWELFLGEEHKGPIALSASGSGIKTVILTLLNLLIRPVIETKPVSSYIFSLEELENNLHPSLQRNLFSFLESFAVEHSTHIFITTHSNVAIDIFSNSENAQILHIKRGPSGVYGNSYQSVIHGHTILDDLGVRASDLLQANGIIWIEGPSDRIYINKWIDIWGEGAYREGHHFQYIYYGGSVLANISAATPDQEAHDAISAFRINRNFIFVCDSDKRGQSKKIKPRVAKLLSEISGNTGLVWVTQAREIENYIPKESIETAHNKTGLKHIGEFEGIQDYLQENKISKATEYRDKHAKAVQYAQHFTKENLSFRPELDDIMRKIIERITSWNS